MSLLEQRVGRSTWAHGIPYSASSSSSSSSTLSNANIVSEIVRRRDMSGLVNFCHHKSISHARGTASFRGGRVSARRRCYFQLGGRKSILKISSVETHFEYRSNIDIILFPPSREKARAPLFFFLFRATKGAASVVVFIILNARAPSSRRFRRLPHQSFRLIGPRNLPLPTRITQIIVFVPRKRPPKKKKKRAHKRYPLSLSSPRFLRTEQANRERKRGTRLSAFMVETCSRRRITLDSTRIARINPFPRRLKLGRRSSHTRMLKLYRSRCSISKPTVVPPLYIYIYINSQILITIFFLFLPSPVVVAAAAVVVTLLDGWLLAWALFENYLRPLGKMEERKRERDEWKSKISLVSRPPFLFFFIFPFLHPDLDGSRGRNRFVSVL